MTTLEPPYDLWAEETVVGCVVASRRGAELAAGRLCAGDFYNPKHSYLFAAAVHLTADDQAERIASVATATGVDIRDVERLVDERAVAWDSSGGFASRVIDASRRRQLMSSLCEAYNALGSGARIAEIRPALQAIETMLGASA